MSENNSKSGIGFIGALQIAFIVLKLCKIINWSWIWVLSPIWISVAFFFVFLIIGIFVVASEKKKEKKYWED